MNFVIVHFLIPYSMWCYIVLNYIIIYIYIYYLIACYMFVYYILQCFNLLLIIMFLYIFLYSTIWRYVMLYLYLVCRSSIMSKYDKIIQHVFHQVSTLEHVFFYLHCFGGVVAETSVNTMEVVSNCPPPITRLVHRATELVKDHGLWVDVRFVHANNNPGKHVL